jgi:2-polyprenyl-6-methoxyphenol hydroxylase-like FAD-dependent oxidoreductase
MSRRALIIGGSLGGLFAGNLLRSIGWDVTVFERTPGDLSGRGAGLGSRAELFSVLRRIGIVLDDDIGVEVRSRIALDADGAIICKVPVSDVATAWDTIYRVLSRALPVACYRTGMELVSFEQRGNHVSAVFADGSTAEGDLLVGADGMRSTVRKQLLPSLEPDYAGYVAWRSAVTEDQVPSIFRELVLNHMNFCFPDGELALSVPMSRMVDSAAPPRRRCQFSWFRPVDFATGMPELCTDATGRVHGASIPPPLIRQELLDELKRQASTMLAPQIASLIAAAKQPILQPIFELESSQLVFGRVVLLGDAAFAARPHVGTGVTKAALDAQCLADTLWRAGKDLDAALHHYDRKRLRFGRWLVARGRYLGAYLSAQHKPREQRSGRELYRRPDTVLREFGGAGVIEGEPAAAWHW